MHSAHKRLGVEVFVPGKLDKDVPCCPHGPMLMFERYFESKPPRKFYSCSACRDRKDCSFFQWVDEKVSATSEDAHQEIIEASKPPFNRKQCCKRLQSFQGLSETERAYCHSCNRLILSKEHSYHKDHEIVSSVSDKILENPSHLLKPFEKKKYYAQYLFSDATTEFFLKTFKKLGFNNVLCIGAPRIHEAIQSKRISEVEEMDSLLLDLDHRYGQFNDDKHFIHYNMFNHHFFDQEHAQRCIRSFLKKSNLLSTVVVMDPPFGGLVQVLASSLRKMWEYANDIFNESEEPELPTFWIFPYFMESRIVEELPSLAMCDYKVDYDNHPLYKKPHGKSAKVSPVRIFTNIPVERLVLSKKEGYRYCERCKRYVNENNVHCEVCDSCTSKDGRVWVHCERCKKCVKQGRVHCETCNRCDLPNHICERNVRGCHVCGNLDHKRKNCLEKLGKEKDNNKRTNTKPSRKRRKTS